VSAIAYSAATAFGPLPARGVWRSVQALARPGEGRSRGGGRAGGDLGRLDAQLMGRRTGLAGLMACPLEGSPIRRA